MTSGIGKTSLYLMFLFYNSCLHAQTSYRDAISSHDSPVISEIVFTSIPFAIITLAIRTFPSRPAVLGCGVDDVLVIPFGNHILLVYKFRVPVELCDLACPEEPLEDIRPELLRQRVQRPDRFRA